MFPKVVTDGTSVSDTVALPHEKLNFSFAGCGFLGIYHIGVASCLREYAPEHTIKNKIGGASAGAMVAALLLCEAPLGFCTSWTLRLAAKARKRSLGPMHPSFSITEHLRNGLEEILPANAHETCNGKLHISMTRVSGWKNVVISEFNSRSELIQALLCSSFIPLWSGMTPPRFRGQQYVDGALSDNLPRINSHTITVSPFAGRSSICPKAESGSIYYMHLSNTSIQFSIANLYRISRIVVPPHPEVLSELCKKGFEDALSYLKINRGLHYKARVGSIHLTVRYLIPYHAVELINCSRHLAVRSVLSRTANTTEPATSEDEPDKGDDNGCEHCIANQSDEKDLHPSVLTALQEAIDVVNSSYILTVKNSKFYRTVSVICSPLYLPFDLWIVTIVRLYKWLPFVHTDMKWLIETAIFYAKLVSGKVITRGKHTYTARFVCQLAITEIQQADVMSDMVMTSQAHFHDQRIGFGVGLSTFDNVEYVQNLREQCLQSGTYDSLDIDRVLPSGERCHETFSGIQYDSKDHSLCPSRVVSPVVSRRSSIKPEVMGASSDSDELQSQMVCNQYMETFERCVEVADHTEAVLAYYYKDDMGQLKTTEIFKLEETDLDRSPQATELVSALAAKKLRMYGSTRSVISSENIDDDEKEETRDECESMSGASQSRQDDCAM